MYKIAVIHRYIHNTLYLSFNDECLGIELKYTKSYTVTPRLIHLVLGLGPWQMPAVATEQPGIRRPQRAAVSDDHQLHLALVNVDQHAGAPVRVHQEDHGEQSHLKLWAGPHEGTAHGLHQTMPAELQVQHVVVLVRLGREKIRESDYYYCTRLLLITIIMQ